MIIIAAKSEEIRFIKRTQTMQPFECRNVNTQTRLAALCRDVSVLFPPVRWPQVAQNAT